MAAQSLLACVFLIQFANVFERSSPLQSVGPAGQVRLHTRSLQVQIVSLRCSQHLITVMYVVLAFFDGIWRLVQKRSESVYLVA